MEVLHQLPEVRELFRNSILGNALQSGAGNWGMIRVVKMNKFFLIFCSVSLCSCSRQAISEEDQRIHRGEVTLDSIQVNSADLEEDEARFYFFDTTIIDSRIFVASYVSSQNLIVVNDKQDTVFRYEDWVDGVEFIDFDADGYNDILMNYLSNVPNVHELALYNSKTSQFQLVENFSSFPTPQKIDGTRYFYSYHSSGCADSDWASDLFFLKDFLAVRIGNIYGSGCEGNKKNGIFISKVTEGVKEQIQEYVREPGYYEDKFDFIKKYWTENYQLFE